MSKARTRTALKKGFEVQINLNKTHFETKFEADSCPELPEANLEILGVLGYGMFGAAFRARSPEHGIVAVKQRLTMPPDEYAETMEKRLLCALDHVLIPKAYAYYRDTGIMYLITEYAFHGSYRRVMHIKDENLVKPFYAQLALALQFLHTTVKITHGNVHPGNMLLFKGGHLKLGDFARARKGVENIFYFIGNPRYLSPETVRFRGHGSETDWWAFGVVMYEQLMGKHPYSTNEEDDYAELAAVFDQEDLPALKGDLDVTADAEDLIRKTMVLDPSKRAGKGGGGIQEIVDHSWFKGLPMSLYMTQDSVIPEWEHFKLDECTSDTNIEYNNLNQLIGQFPFKDPFEGIM